MSEIPIEESHDLFVGKTIERIDTECCNNIQFAFSDGTRVALHIEVGGLGLPEVLTCTECTTIENNHPAWMYGKLTIQHKVGIILTIAIFSWLVLAAGWGIWHYVL